MAQDHPPPGSGCFAGPYWSGCWRDYHTGNRFFAGILSGHPVFAIPALVPVITQCHLQPGDLAGDFDRHDSTTVLLAGSAVLRIWKLNWLQMLAYAGAVLAFMAIGLVISVKIGGGSNLHNFDMYFVTLALLTGIFLQDADITLPASWPAWLKGFLALVIFLPVMNAVRVGTPLVLPSHQVVQSSLESIQSEVQRALDEGEVLFSDQRQLLTFGYMEDVPLVTEYEKKYLMEMAMANNLAYFRSFYDDLENKRFSLIVINPLHRTKQDELSGFAAENNAWVKWVARPVLCYYKPLKTFEEVRVQLLVPRPDPHRCPDYIFEE